MPWHVRGLADLMATIESEHPEGAGLWLTPRLRVACLRLPHVIGSESRCRVSLSALCVGLSGHNIGSPSLDVILVVLPHEIMGLSTTAHPPGACGRSAACPVYSLVFMV